MAFEVPHWTTEGTDWTPEFRRLGAVYERPDLPGAPHVDTLKSDTHSGAYFKSEQVVEHVGLMDDVAEEWAELITAQGMIADRVIGHAPFAEPVAQSLARALTTRSERPVLFGYSKLMGRGGYQIDFRLHPGERIIFVADDVVTGESTVSTIRDAESKGGITLRVVPCLANLSLSSVLSLGDDRESLPLLAASTFHPERYRTRVEACRFCEIGSVALPPRGRNGEDWEELQRWMTAVNG
jgi:orotate phosphoribosyltransferase